MKIYNFLVINKESGITIHHKNYGLLVGEATQFLFSGAMVAIQNLMNEIRVGRVKTIKTEDYHIIGELTDRFVIFAVGIFDNVETMVNFLEKLGEMLESWVSPEDIIIKIPSTIINIIDAMFDQFLAIWTTLNMSAGIFLWKKRLGYQNITPFIDHKIELLLTGYFSTLPQVFRDISHAFFEILPSGGSVLGLMFNKFGKNLIFYFYFEDLEPRIILCNKQNFLNRTYDFMQSVDFEEIIKNEEINKEAFESWDLFNTELINSINTYTPTNDFFKNDDVLKYIQPKLPEILDTFMKGRPVAILCEKSYANQVIDMLLYITGTTSASLDVDTHNPQRIVWANSNQFSELIKLNYSIINLDEKFETKYNNSYFNNICQSIFEPNKTLSELLSDLKTECTHLWDICNGILVQLMFGQTIELNFDRIDNNQKAYLEKFISSINPYILMKKPMIIGEKKNNW